MILSLDTTVLIDVVNGRSERVRSLYGRARAARSPWVICSIAYHEVLLGGAIRGDLGAEKQLVDSLFRDAEVVAFKASHAHEAALLSSELRRRGETIDGFDLLIGAQARAEGWAVATANLRHFNRMPNLQVEDWSA